MIPSNLQSTLIVIGLGLGAAGTSYLSNISTYSSTSIQNTSNTITTLFHRTEAKYQVVLSHQDLPLKWLFGKTLFNQSCSRPYPRISLENQNQIHIACGTVKQNFDVSYKGMDYVVHSY